MNSTEQAGRPENRSGFEDTNSASVTQPAGRDGAAKLGSDAIPGLTPPRSNGPSFKRMMAFGILVVSFIAVLGFVGHRLLGRRADQPPAKAPDVASLNANKLRLPDPTSGTIPLASAAASMPSLTRLPGTVPAIKTDGPADAQPIGVVPNIANAPRQATASNGKTPPNPIDAPMFAGAQRAAGSAGQPRGTRTSVAGAGDDEDPSDSLARTLASLAERKQELQAALDRAQGKTSGSSNGTGNSSSAAPLPGMPASYPSPPTYAGYTAAQAAAAMRAAAAGNTTGNAPPDPNAGRLFGSLEQSVTHRAQAQLLAQRTLTIPKGTLFSCALKTRVVTATSGLVGCLVQRNVYGHDGKVLLVERGSHLDGEYRMVAVRPGLTRIPVVWTRVLTPYGVTVDLESPATGQLGESGIGGHVDNRWTERIGAAVLVSLIDDAIKLAVDSQASSSDGSSTVYLPSTSAQGSKLAEEVLKSTINIPPLLYADQGGVVGVYVARDLDFSGVYKLQPQ